MFCSLKYCIRTLSKPSVLTGVRNCSQFTEQNHSNFGKNGHFDIIIVGGGATGISLAGAIAKNPKLSEKKVLLLDASPSFKGYNENVYSNRVYSINHNTVELMKYIGAWDTIKSIRIRPVKQMQVWDACSDALITFNHDNFIGDVAYVVENDVLVHSILKELQPYNNITIRNDAKIDKVILEQDGSTYGKVQLASGEDFSAELLVGADGANSMVRKQMNANHFALSYNQMGLIATVELGECDDNFVAWQRFLPNSVIALLPLSENLSSIVWSTYAKHFKHLMQLDEADFIDAVNNAFLQKYEKNSVVEMAMGAVRTILNTNSSVVRQLPPQITGLYGKSRAGFPLGFGHASSYVGRGVALIGDAAHRIHPLAGMGLNLGFGDVKCLTETLAKATYNGFALNDLNHLCEYEQQRLKLNVPIMLGVHGLQQLYSTDLSPVVLARSIGLQITQQVPPLKKFFMQKAMG
ncbi:ubiquinone biosynthesis monooxygenase COQ6, mitochondrial [Contarinia nasturtii]|uniref:ubiquinone biosynthesis monooxygenase COQ6, mitochondrial n=1 Tax=Contarinia nasturtii TaxID=265458 RepID=UPI0012D3E4F3|nr:ubiquinone biosynthesis monooxygenase COQ6, mitochondrial [Contarinia nasturtii]